MSLFSSPKVAAALHDALGDDADLLRRYPNPQSMPLRETIAKHHGVTVDQVCVGNGSDDILNLLIRCFCTQEGSTGFTLPSYSLYPVLVGIQNGASTVLELDRSMRLPIGRIAESSAKIFFLTSPNAPTGVGFTNDEIEQVLQRFSGVLVVDEAYAAFAKENAVKLLAKYPRLVVVRTLSKAYALAGIRIGYALAHPELIGLLDRVRDSYNVSRLSQVAAQAAFDDPHYYTGIINKVRHTRDHYVSEWKNMDWFTYRSQANFIFTEPRNTGRKTGPEVAKALYDYLLERKILVRYFPSHALTASFLRISVGTDEEMLILQETFEAWLKNA